MTTVRQSKPGDLEALARIHEAEEWIRPGRRVARDGMIEWSLARPSIAEGGAVLVAETEDGINGYLAVAENGQVLDLVASPKDRRKVGSQLLAAAIKHLESRGAPHIRMELPSEDDDLCAAARDLGLTGTPAHNNVWLATIDTSGLIVAITAEWEVDWQLTFVITDTGEELVIGDGEPAIRVRGSARALARVLLGHLSATRALALRRIRVSPSRHVLQVRKALETIQVQGNWFMPPGDIL